MKMKVFNFLRKISTDFKFSMLSDHEKIVFILIYKKFPKTYERVWGYENDFYCFCKSTLF